MIEPLTYERRVSTMVEDTRRCVVMRHPGELCSPDERGIYRWNRWRGVEKNGAGIWQTEEVWGREIVPFPYSDDEQHITRRDVCVDVECAQMPEEWWSPWFGGMRGKTLRAAKSGGGEERIDVPNHSAFYVDEKGTSIYFGAERAAVRFCIYVKYLRPGVHVNVRQEHLDSWTAYGWRGGMVVRVEARLTPPSVLIGDVASMWADAAARIRLLDEVPRGRASNVATARRWLELGEPPQKLERPPVAKLEKHERLLRAMAKLQAEHGAAAVHLAMLATKYTPGGMAGGRPFLGETAAARGRACEPTVATQHAPVDKPVETAVVTGGRDAQEGTRRSDEAAPTQGRWRW